MPDEIPGAVPAASTPVESVAPAAAPSAPVPPTSAQVESSSLGSAASPASSPTGESVPSTTTSPSGSPDVAAKAAPEFAPSLLDAATAPPESTPAREGTPAGDKPADAKTDAPGETPPAPVKYEFTYPEGFDSSQVNTERMSAYTGVLGEAKVAPEVGQKLLDLHLQEVTQATERLAQRQWDVFNETQKQWRDEVMADPELGGSNHKDAITTIMSLVDLYGGNAAERKGLLDAFRVTGAANNPHVLRFMHRAAQALSREAEPHAAPPPRAPAPIGRDRSLNRYANTTPAQQQR